MRIYYSILLRHLRYIKDNLLDLENELFYEMLDEKIANDQEYTCLHTNLNNVLLFLETYIEEFRKIEHDLLIEEETQDEKPKE